MQVLQQKKKPNKSMLKCKVKLNKQNSFMLALKALNTAMAEFANTVDPDETAHYPHLDPLCLPSSRRSFNIILLTLFCCLPSWGFKA